MPEPDNLPPLATLGTAGALLLGMLGSPMTSSELHELIAKSATSPVYAAILDEHRSGAEAKAALERLHAGGVAEVRRTLERLERAGVVRRQRPSAGNESHLWWRVQPAEWPSA